MSALYHFFLLREKKKAPTLVEAVQGWYPAVEGLDTLMWGLSPGVCWGYLEAGRRPFLGCRVGVAVGVAWGVVGVFFFLIPLECVPVGGMGHLAVRLCWRANSEGGHLPP